MSSPAQLFDPEAVDEVRSQFEKCRYVALRGLLQPGLTSMLCSHIQTRAEAGVLDRAHEEELKNSLEKAGDPLMENILRGLTPRVEELAGRALYPTYSFVRVYRTGDRLDPHLDRPSCEVSLSLNLGQDCTLPWPLWIKGPCGTKAAKLNPGDALLYRGNECKHWRDVFTGTQLTQVFLHYVDQNGPHAPLRFDGRMRLSDGNPGLSPESD